MQSNASFKINFRTGKELKSKSNSGLSDEDKSLMEMLESLQKNIEAANSNLEYATDPLLIDGYIYELKALHVKYEYYIKRCKDLGLVAGIF